MAKIAIAGVEIRCEDRDIERILAQKWHMSKKGYVASKIDGKTILIQNFLMNPPTGYDVHHVDGDRLNELYSNLEVLLHGDHTRITNKSESQREQWDKNRRLGWVANRSEKGRERLRREFRQRSVAFWKDPEKRESAISVMRERWADPLAREGARVRARDLWNKPGARERQSEIMKSFYARKRAEKEQINLN